MRKREFAQIFMRRYQMVEGYLGRFLFFFCIYAPTSHTSVHFSDILNLLFAIDACMDGMHCSFLYFNVIHAYRARIWGEISEYKLLLIDNLHSFEVLHSQF